jgi:precorrin-6Y C5,15-methyltransferase (decarboxylating)
MAADELERRGAEPWLAVIGIGEDGLTGLGEAAKQHIARAEAVFGGKRHLDLVASIVSGDIRPWPSPFDPGMQEVLALSGRRVCVIASGDPMFFGVGATLAARVPPYEMTVLPAPSAFSLAAARLGWALQDVDMVSLHGRSLDLVRPYLQPGRRILVLTSDAAGPRALADLLTKLGFGRSRMTVLEALGGPRERIRSAYAEAVFRGDFNPLNTVALEIEASSDARILPLARGLVDDLFEHDGQITKREVRAVTLSTLEPRRGELLWDIGAGSGSVAIEWMLTDRSLRAIAIEADANRTARIRRNAASCGVPLLTVVEGSAPAALDGLPVPAAIFIGGGGTTPGVVERAMDALPTGGRLVANAVTLGMEARLLQSHAAFGGDLIRISVSRESAVGSMSAWRPALPVTQWSWIKP